MREINKARGIEKNGRAWIYGNYVYEPMYNDIDHKPSKPKHWIREYNKGQTVIMMFEVHPKTVGEFTGIQYQNGIDAYEGDIIKWKDKIWVIEWIKDMCKFEISNKKDGELFEAYCFNTDVTATCKKLGNTFNNPELL